MLVIFFMIISIISFVTFLAEYTVNASENTCAMIFDLASVWKSALIFLMIGM